MADDSPASPIAIELDEPVPAEVDAGAELSLAIAVTPCSACDPGRTRFEIRDGGRVLEAGDWPASTDDGRAAAIVTVRAPGTLGTHAWTLVVLSRAGAGAAEHELASIPVHFRTRPHATSLAVWGAHPTPAVRGGTLSVHLGARCVAGCALTGMPVEIRDEAGGVVAGGLLGGTPWLGTAALHWTRVEMAAPAGEGPRTWRAICPATASGLPHAEASAAFGFVTVGPPEHAVSVEVLERATAAPLGDVLVRLGPCRASTDAAGVVRFGVPAGEYRLAICKTGYAAPERTVVVAASHRVRVEARAVPEEDPDAFWKG